MAPAQTRAVVLRGYDYGDSSRILRFYTEDHGLLSVVARGVRGRSGRGAASVPSFASGDLTAFVRAHRDLHTMKDFSCTRPREELGGDVLRFAGASACAELVLVHAEQEPNRPLFAALEASLDSLASVPRPALPGAILAGLWTIVEGFGFAPQLRACVRCDEVLGEEELGRFDFAAGGMRCARCGQDAAGPRVGPGARAQIEVLLGGGAPPGFSHARVHLALVADFVAYHLASKPLKSFAFLAGLLPKEEEAPVA